ncbi:MAG: hypothetical protein JSU85_09370 [Candidatus Zixiibacteriota bacterium]|nr:MAG: hypothetical protein JSU85_09370 [candidate division Zixibacteria bacterium]
MKRLILILCLIAIPVYGADSVITICPSGCDYTSLITAVANEDMDVTSLDPGDSLFFEISGTWSGYDQGMLTIDTAGYKTDSDNGIKIYTTGSARHPGVWSTTAYRLVNTDGDWQIPMEIQANYVEIDGLQIEFYRSAGTNRTYAINENYDPNGTTIRNCIIICDDSSTVQGAIGIRFGLTDLDSIYIYINLIYGFSSRGVSTVTGSGGSIVYSNTVANCGVAYESDIGRPIFKNNIVTECGAGWSSNNVHDSTGYNATDSASLGYTAQTGDSVDAEYSFVNVAAKNWHWSSPFAGADLSSDPFLAFTTDIDGQTRTDPWDRGMDEYVAAGTVYRGQIISIGGN